MPYFVSIQRNQSMQSNRLCCSRLSVETGGPCILDVSDAPRPDNSQLDTSESQRICDDRDGAERHGCTSDDRAQQQPGEGVQHPGRNRNAESVVHEGEEEVLSDVAHRGVAETTG